MEALPAAVITRFRALAQDRLNRIEAQWSALLRGEGGPEAEAEMLRDAHTLKGDARLINFADVHLLCGKLEDLLLFAGKLDYRVNDEIDIVVTMTLQFIGMLARKKVGTELGGIDLGGFVKQIDEALQSAQEPPPNGETEPVSRTGAAARASPGRVCPETRQRLAVAATTAYIEYLNAVGGSRRRLYGLWRSLCQEVSSLEATPLLALLERHVTPTEELAAELGKRAQVRLELDDLRVPTEVAEALDVAVLHALRNAADHGLEPEARRAAAGKPGVGTILVRSRVERDAVELRIEDDGAGIDLEAIRAKALARGVLSQSAAARATARELMELLFRSGFSTRATATDVSGRGVGLDAVKTIVERVRGSVSIAPRPEGGTVLIIRVPQACRQIEVHRFVTPQVALFLALPDTWEIDPASLESIGSVLDPLQLLGIEPKRRQTPLGVPAGDGSLRPMCARLGSDRVALMSATAPQRCVAVRMCPTGDNYPVEVVSIDGIEALLIRPDKLQQYEWGEGESDDPAPSQDSDHHRARRDRRRDSVAPH